MKHERRVRWTVRLAGPVVRLLACTWRIESLGDDGWRALRAAGKPHVLTAWHGHLLPILWARRGEGISAMVSEHRDGEIIARLMQNWGFRTVRGSSTRGAGRALRGMLRALEEGQDFAITPDGPRGPAGTVQPGVLLASQRAQVAIIPTCVEASRAWRASSWDRMLLPKPFARVRIRYGEPWIAPAADAAAAAELQARLGAALPTEPRDTPP